MRDIISMRDFTREDVDALLREASRMEELLASPERCAGILQNRLVANMFFEASTRTNQSFQAAANRLGAKILVFHPQSGSGAKGESFSDTMRMVDGYSDAVIVRHPCEGAARLAADVCEHPVINAGDGGNQHPTQAFIDLYTVRKLKGKVGGVKVVLFGDLAHARSMHSLLYGLSMFKAKITLCSPPGLGMAEWMVEEARRKFGAKVAIEKKPDLSSADVLYTCRVQKERFGSPREADAAQAAFRVSKKLLEGANEELAILHPLPKVDEIDAEVDSDPRARYFEQAKNGVPVRMAALAMCMRGFGREGKGGRRVPGFSCKNQSCISGIEKAHWGWAEGAGLRVRCRYCERPAG